MCRYTNKIFSSICVFTAGFFLFAVILLHPFSVFADQCQDGVIAYKNKNYTEAVRLLHPLAEKGNPEAQVTLGDMYLHGYGVLQSDNEAFEWFTMAARQGNIEAQIRLGDLCMTGRGPSHNWNHREALKWYKKAAEQGNVMAQMKLGNVYTYRDVRDPVMAYMWYEIALANGIEECEELEKTRKKLARIKQSQIIEVAKLLSHEWRAKHSSVPGTSTIESDMDNDRYKFDGLWIGEAEIFNDVGPNYQCSGSRGLPIAFYVLEDVAISMFRQEGVDFRATVKANGRIKFKYENASVSDSGGSRNLEPIFFSGKLKKTKGKGSLSFFFCRGRWTITKKYYSNIQPAKSNLPKEIENKVDEIIYDRLRDGWRDAGYSEKEIEKMLDDYKRRMKGEIP